MENKRPEQQYMGNRHTTSERNFAANNTPGQYNRGQNMTQEEARNYKRDFGGSEPSHRNESSRYDSNYNSSIRNARNEDRSQFRSQYSREDYLSDHSRPYSEGVASYSRPYSSDSEYLGQDGGYSSRPDTYSSSYPHQTSYGQGNYSTMYNTDRGISRKEGYGQYPQQNWKNTNEGQWQTSSSSSSQSFFGKGPKGFKRSDERIKEDVCEALYRDHSIDASEIDVTVQGGEITLSGTVTERRMKRLAEDCVEAVSGVTDVKNEIKVQSASSERSFGSDDTTYADKNMDRNDKTKNRTGLSNKVM